MRPASIRRFEYLYWISIALALGASLAYRRLIWDAMASIDQVREHGGPMVWVSLFFLAGIAIYLVPVYFVARRRSAVAKWVLIGLLALNGFSLLYPIA